MKKESTHRQRKHKELLERVHERNCESSSNIPRNFQMDSVVQVIIVVHLLKKGKQKVNG